MQKTEKAKTAEQYLEQTVEELQALQAEVGREAGGREVALAVTNAEQSLLWLRQALTK